MLGTIWSGICNRYGRLHIPRKQTHVDKNPHYIIDIISWLSPSITESWMSRITSEAERLRTEHSRFVLVAWTTIWTLWWQNHIMRSWMTLLATTDSRYGFVRLIQNYSMTGRTFVLNRASGLLVYTLWHKGERPYKFNDRALTLNHWRLGTKTMACQNSNTRIERLM